MGTFEEGFRPHVVEKRKNLIKKNEMLGYVDRIVIRAEELVVDQLMKLGLKNTDMRNALEAVQQKLADEKFIQGFKGQWQEKLGTTDDPERTEEELAKGLALVLKSDLDIKHLPIQKAA